MMFSAPKMVLCSPSEVNSDRPQIADRISELPDEVLISILSHLSISEAARTITLSRRWKKIWKLMMVWTLSLQGTGRE